MDERYCPQCGAPIEEGAVKCRFCEIPIVEGEVIEPDRSYGQQSDKQPDSSCRQQSNKQQTYISNTAGGDRILAAISYVGILVLIPILAKPDSHFIRFHVNQGLILFLLDSAIMLAGGIFGGIALIAVILKIVRGLSYILLVLGVLSAVQGRERELPFIGKIRLIK